MDTVEEKDVTVSAIMTAPRYCSVYARNQIEHALQAVGIPLAISGGVFYGQCMQRMLTDVCQQGVEYALTVDFDSMFTAAHVRRLLNIIAQEEEVDALAAMQPMRGQGRILASVAKEEKLEWHGRPLEVRSAHFGLTLIDLAKLKDVPKPWFHSQPDEHGDWGDKKVDDDVSFWNAWRTAGNSIYIDPGCRLGHLEEMITVYEVQEEELQLKHHYPREWEQQRDSAVD